MYVCLCVCVHTTYFDALVKYYMVMMLILIMKMIRNYNVAPLYVNARTFLPYSIVTFDFPAHCFVLHNHLHHNNNPYVSSVTLSYFVRTP